MGIVLCFCGYVVEGMSQRLLDRFVPYVPDIQRITRSQESLRGWGSFEGYLFQSDSLHGWRQVMGAMVDFWRRDTTILLSFVAAIEFHANFNNDIAFNPRAQFWEEGLVLSFFADDWVVQTGYLHRCKHDIDNLALGQERTLIYGSAFVNAYCQVVPKTDSTGILLGLSSHFYLVHEDYRTPDRWASTDPRISTLVTANVFSLIARYRFVGALWGVRATVQAASFAADDRFAERLRSPIRWRFSWMGTLEYFLSPIARLFLRIEKLHDALIALPPESTFHVQLGLGFVPNSLW